MVELNHSNVRVSTRYSTDADASYAVSPATEIGRVPPAVVAQKSMKEVHLG